MKGYKVELEQFSGPLDLLLYLVRREEVAIEDLRIADLTEQYLAYMDQADAVDVDSAGDYLVMAAQLLQLKARALLPEIADAADAAPPLTRHQLIANLLEYRTLQEEARLLEAREARWALSATRTSARSFEDIPLRHVDAWDLFTAYRRLEEETLAKEREAHAVDADEQPLHEHIAQLRERLAVAAEGLRFDDALAAEDSRAARVAAFLALLELIRLHEVRARQEGPFGEIVLTPVPPGERAALRAEDALEEGQKDAAPPADR